NDVWRSPPSVVRATTQASPTSAAMRPYSIKVTPFSSFRNLRIIRFLLADAVTPGGGPRAITVRLRSGRRAASTPAPRRKLRPKAQMLGVHGCADVAEQRLQVATQRGQNHDAGNADERRDEAVLDHRHAAFVLEKPLQHRSLLVSRA